MASAVASTYKEASRLSNRCSPFLSSALEGRVQAEISSASAKPQQAPSNVTDELAKLADLVERGFLSRYEFDSRKRVLLSR
jgi:hypothetical protein